MAATAPRAAMFHPLTLLGIPGAHGWAGADCDEERRDQLSSSGLSRQRKVGYQALTLYQGHAPAERRQAIEEIWIL